MEEENGFLIDVGGKKIESLEQLKELPTTTLKIIREDLCEAKLKSKRAYKMCAVNIVLGTGLITLSLFTGAVFGSFIGGYFIGKGLFRNSNEKAKIKIYEKIVNAINDEISYREFGKELFPEFSPEEPQNNLDIFDLLNIEE